MNEKWRSKRNFRNLRLLSAEELAMEDVNSPEIHIPLSDILADVESGRMYIDYPGGLEQFEKDAMREKAQMLQDSTNTEKGVE